MPPLLFSFPQDFIERMPLRSITNPRLGWATLNLASMLRPSDNPTDLGPKCYLAYGRQQESTTEGDSVTKLHKDMTDAINILVQQEAGGDAAARQQLTKVQQGQGGVAAATGAARGASAARAAKKAAAAAAAGEGEGGEAAAEVAAGGALMAVPPQVVRCGDEKATAG